MRKYETVQEMRDGWTCYMGATAYPDPTKLYTQQMFRERFGRGYFWNTGEPPVHSESGINEQMPWLADPTAGMQRYDKGCEYINDLLVPREDGKPGFSLKAMRPSTLGGYSFDFTDEVTGETDYASANEAYVLRLESNDVVNGGLTVIDVDYLPWGAGVWPAFWMVGSEPNDWLQHPPKNPGLGLRNYWPYRGEIDIIEYINAYTVEQQGHEFRNHVTLHTSCGCMSNRSSPSGRGDLSGGEDDCCAGDAFTGCQASMGPNTVGHPGFRGAIYVCDWIKDSHVDCWFFNKDERGTYAEPGEFEFPDSNWAVRPYHPAEAWLTIVLEFEDGRVEDEKTFVLYEVPSGESPDSQLYSQSQWVSTFGTCTTTPPSNTCSAKYGSTYNSGWKDRMLPFGDYSFRIHTTSGDDEWQPKWNLHAHPDDPGLSDDPPYTLTVDRGGEYVITIPIAYQGHHVQGTILKPEVVTIPNFQPPSPPPLPKYPESHGPPSPPHKTSPIDFSTATSVNVADLGPPDVRHDLKPGCHKRQGHPTDNALADMRFILNTVICGQWSGNMHTNSMPEDPEQMSYEPLHLAAWVTPECDAAARAYIGSKKKRDGNRDYLHRRFDWDISYIKQYT